MCPAVWHLVDGLQVGPVPQPYKINITTETTQLEEIKVSEAERHSQLLEDDKN